MAFSLDYHLLRTSHPKHGGPYLHRVAVEQRANSESISHQLLQAVATESLPPRVYELWLCACTDESAITLGLQQEHSLTCRRSAIKALQRWFRTAKCIDIWRAMRGTDTIVTMLASFSVDHVKAFCKRLGRCSTSQSMRTERQDLVTDLMYSLASRAFPDAAKVQNPDHRPLLEAYAMLVYACTPQARDAWIDHETLPKLDMTKVMRTDTEHYQKRCLRMATTGEVAMWKYSPLFISPPSVISNKGHNISRCLEFAAEVLETVVSYNNQPSDDVSGVGDVLVKMVKVLARRKVSPAFALKMTKLIASCGQSHVVQELRKYNVNYHEYLLAVAHLWSYNPDAFEPYLSGMLQTSMQTYSTRNETFKLLSSVAPEKRYKLFKWLNIRHHDIDINNTDQLLSLRHLVWWFVTALPKSEARSLTERIVSLKGEQYNWLEGGWIVPEPDLERSNVKLELLRCLTLDSDEARLTQASEITAMYQEMAQKERDADCRIGWAIAAATLAVGSGSLDLLKDVLVWARRFNRDPLISRFYDRKGLITTETISILAGIPEEPAKNMDRATVETGVRKGNEVVLLLWETAAMCQTEPAFYANHWVLVEHLFVDMMQVRFQRFKRLQSLSGLSHDDIYETIWKPTLDALLDAEKLGLADRNQALCFNTLGGPLAVWNRGEITIKNPSRSVCRFVDELARRRDALWQTYRPSVHPAAVTLQAPLPKGLPIQALLPVQIEGTVSDESLPFICERVRNVIFASREVALRPVPEGKDIQAAIGYFVDNYSAALRIYLSWCDQEEKQRRIKVAWEHATVTLSEGRLSRLEATVYWEEAFTEAGVSLPASILNYPERPAPRLPNPDIDNEMTEWNPDEGPQPSLFEERTLEPTFLDCNFTLVSTYSRDINSNFSMPRPTITPPVLPDFWDLDQFGSVIPSNVKEAFIVAGLLLLDTLPQVKSKVLSTSYPTRDEVRFPALFLDMDFVVAHRGFETLPERLLNDTPPALLDQLTAALFTKLDASDDPDRALVRYAFKTLRSLAWSDRPELAIKHIIHVIIDLPEHSSWHRVMLHRGILKRLNAQQSKALIAGLASAVAEKSKQRSQSKTGDDASVKKSYVKVSTIKMLAQLMSNAEFVDEAFSVEMLGKLFKESTHIDIRTAIVESLIDVISSTKDLDIEESAIRLLETDVVPVASQLSERTLLSEKDWKDREMKGELPEVDAATPIRDAVWAYTKQQYCRHSESKIAELVRRLILPLVNQSKANTHRWMQTFLRVHGLSEGLAAQLPEALGSQVLLCKLLNDHTAHMPAAFFQGVHALTIFFAQPPKELQMLQERLASTKPKPPGCDTWHKATNSAITLLTSLNTSQLLKTAIFAPYQDAVARDLVTTSQLKAHEQAVIDILLANFDRFANEWKFFTESYRPPLRQRESVQSAWRTFCMPLVQYMVERTETLRSTAWRQDPRRQPGRLPDVYPLKLWLLSYPSMPWRDDAEYRARREKFAAEVHDLVDELAADCIERGRPYHARLNLVVEAAKGCYEKDWAYLAWKLGGIADGPGGQEFGLAELLRIEVADALLQGAKMPVDEAVLRGVEVMLGRWRASFDEQVRERGIVTTETLRENSRKKKRDALPFE